MQNKYVFVTGGVVSGLGKGITAASLGRLLKARGMSVTMQKFDPYINMDPGTMNPIQHGEVFVTEDGAETDLDLGHYERFIDESLTRVSTVTSGQIWWSVLSKERHGDYHGGTVQVIPHITDEIKSRFYQISDQEREAAGVHVTIIEVGGTTGDIESQPFIEAIRQFRQELGPQNSCLIHVSLVPYIKASGELKTKPTQSSVKGLQGQGLTPDIIVCRTEYPIDLSIREKIALFCNVPVSHVLENKDVDFIYEAPLAMEKEHLAEVVCECLNVPCEEPELSDWESLVKALREPEKAVEIALVGKYTSLHDAYLSVAEALKHGGIYHRAEVKIRWVDAEEVTEKTVEMLLQGVDGVIVPGGFGERGIEGMIEAERFVRERGIPFLGICLGMQTAIIEIARHVAGLKDAGSIEFDSDCPDPVIALLPDQDKDGDIGGTLRLGSYPCVLQEGTKAEKAYGSHEITERHRHRYEVNNDYRSSLTQAGMLLCGKSPDGSIVEMVELSEHPWFVATQAHPEFKSRPNRAHPLFRDFIGAALKNKEK